MKKICVTGAARGLGLALTKQMLERGYSVYAAGLGVDESDGIRQLEAVYAERLRVIDLDIADDLSVALFTETVKLDTDHLDMLINNAAILGSITDHIHGQMNIAEMAEVFNVNTLGSLRVTHALFPLLLQGQTKLIVDISSEAGSIEQCSRDGWFAYCMSKAALNMQARLIHNGLKQEGGQVMLVHPGWVQSYMRGELDASADLTPDESAQHIAALIDRHEQFKGEQPAYVDYRGEKLPW
ncbi:NAD(P)-dependent dehydrogenase (short-subunit alcohol dehydrogenase family) [Paenibacillus barcinonensis]|uniref:NAD(P)-dependent dehydrogenase (Short-subunit alcohol dehydrogenase family) n=1 Tax=Paenibacillus barcinonensis TaxID=198119 RepID=A0A2V4VZ02_PAEBA|nr:SDR family oxidoreductase [Paenibacillus barcinonensis]PYE50780.1 NAD(P)-dependent dehydrogenase (short-subunit alcohol dehydrogenase family) [Paenibacillus barcinonensis]